MVEKGDAVDCPFLIDDLYAKTLHWILLLGRKYVMKWITNIAIGIAELEELGIYHADLAFRNTIRVTHGEWSAFKIIDFNRAFKVIQTKEKDKSFECTK
jgi:tRNA A-37 threonylcarbamoyl transferase component Bud32